MLVLSLAFPSRHLALCLSLVILGAGFVRAQDALRESLAGERAAEARRKALDNKDYNLNLGLLNLRFDTSLQTEFNDNIRVSDQNQLDDIILQPGLRTAGHLPLTEKNALNFSVDLGYEKYIDHSQYDRFIVAPGSEIAFDLFLKDFRFTFYDRFSYTQNPLLNPSVNETADYGSLQNTAGLKTMWDLNRAIQSVDYAFQLWESTTEIFSYQDRTTHLVTFRTGFFPHPALLTGPEATVGLNEYDQNILNESTSVSAGWFASTTWCVSTR